MTKRFLVDHFLSMLNIEIFQKSRALLCEMDQHHDSNLQMVGEAK